MRRVLMLAVLLATVGCSGELQFHASAVKQGGYHREYIAEIDACTKTYSSGRTVENGIAGATIYVEGRIEPGKKYKVTIEELEAK